MLEQKLTEESNSLYKAFDDARAKFFREQRKLNKMNDFAISQEVVVTEIKALQFRVLNDVFRHVEALDPGQIQNCLDMIKGHRQFSRLEKDNPLTIYLGYLDYHRFITTQPSTFEVELKKKDEQIKELNQRILESKLSTETAQFVSKMFLEQESGLKTELESLREEM